ncbi:MAG: GHMP kinase [Cyanobacteria bacterium P01_A01_bin.45]
MKLFVPGRLCLFGEHSDWAGSYRSRNKSLCQGFTLLTGTNQGLYADVKPYSKQLILRTCIDGREQQILEMPMNRDMLLTLAQSGSLFSYAAGVAHQILTHFQVDGLEINNYYTDLPIQKGLSSSAAICVLVARAFNRVYDLKLTTRGEMEFAYLGEVTTPSKCGRMDQACAYGNVPIAMSFDGSFIDVMELKVSQNLFLVIVDLGASKNTQEILAKLNECYPIPENKVQEGVQKFLGEISHQITNRAVVALQKGDAEEIGRLMQESQLEFDKYLIPACPQELTAPVLHHLLNYEPIKPYIWGGKGVGSQGDGTAQFIAKDEISQQKVIEIIEREFPQMQCLKLKIEVNDLCDRKV